MTSAKYPLPGSEAYRVIRDGTGSIAGAAPAGTYLFYPAGAVLRTSAAAAIAAMRFDPINYPAPKGYKLKLRVRGRLAGNDVAPGAVSWTFGMRGVSAPVGATGTLPSLTVGTIVPGSDAAVLGSPIGANAFLNHEGADFDPPAAGWYALYALLSGATAAGSNHQIMARLDYRFVPGDG